MTDKFHWDLNDAMTEVIGDAMELRASVEALLTILTPEQAQQFKQAKRDALLRLGTEFGEKHGIDFVQRLKEGGILSN